MEEVSPIERIPVGYIERRVTKTETFRPIFEDGAIEFDKNNGIFRYLDPDRSKLHTAVGVTIDQQSERMKAAIKAYETSSKQEYFVRWDPGKTGSFDLEKILRDVEESTEAYLAKGRAEEGFRNRIRGCLRKFSDRSESLLFWLDFLPNDSYGSLIYGGVAFILKAAAKIGQAREGVLEALADIPEIIASASIFDTMYKDAPRLTNAVSALYVATLHAMEHILLWFHQKAARKFFESRKYGDILDARIGAVRKFVKAVQTEAEICQQKVNLDTNKLVNAMRIEQANAFYLSNENLKDHINAAIASQATSLRSDILNDLYRLFVNSEMIQSMVRRQSQLQIESSRERDEPRYGERPSLARRLTGISWSAPTPEPQPARKDITKDELLNFIGSPITETANSDILRSLEAEMTLREQDRVQAIIRSDQLKAFFSSKSSTMLLVEGNTGAHDTNSSISFFSATLVDSIRKLGLPVVHFFCGLHHNSKPPIFNGPDGMMRALVRQLLSVNGSDRISLKKSTMEKLRQSDKTTRKLVKKLLVKQRQKSVTFCIIDGVSFFETAKWEKRLKTAFISLAKAVNNPKGNGVIKLLITTPESSRCIPRMIEPKQILSIQKDVIEGFREGLGSEEVEFSVKEAVGSNWRQSVPMAWR